MSRLSGRQMEKLGRLNTPLYKGPRSTRWRPVSWDWAMEHAASRLKPLDPNRTFFYSSGRSSNEAAFLLQWPGWAGPTPTG